MKQIQGRNFSGVIEDYHGGYRCKCVALNGSIGYITGNDIELVEANAYRMYDGVGV